MQPIGSTARSVTALRAALLLSLAGAGVSSYLLANHYGLAGCGVCSLFETWSCDVVNRSPYSAVAGVPVALLAVVGFSALFAIAYVGAFHARAWAGVHMRFLLLALAASGAVGGTYLTAVEVWVLRAVCPLCLAAFAIDAALLAVTALWFPRSSAAHHDREDVPVP